MPSKEIRIDPLNECGLAIARVREGDLYQEGIVDAKGKEVLQISSHLLVVDLHERLALISTERKFLFVPLDDGFVSQEDIDSVEGFRYAEPFRCGLALVSLEDTWFYLNTEFERAFQVDFEFAESFHQDRALVQTSGRFRIIDTEGATVADLTYDQVSPQSPWCWQVTNLLDGRYRSGFIDLNGQPITPLDFEAVGYYDPEVKRIWVQRNGLFGYLDEQAQVAIPIQYTYAEAFDRGKAKVQLQGRTFFIDPNGNEIPE